MTGATGFLGRPLAAALRARGDDMVVLARDPERASSILPGVAVFAWDAMAAPPPASALDGADAVIHLAGEPIASGRWTAGRKRRIRDSRVLGTQNLVAGWERLAAPPPVLVSGSAVGIYGDRGDERLEEPASPGKGFLAEVGLAWEAAAAAVTWRGTRLAVLRTGIVLGRGGGALARMLPLFRLGLGGRLGSGRQWMPWIHRDDWVRLALHALDRPTVSGPVNAVAPEPVRQATFARTLGRALHRPAVVPAPAFALRIVLGEFANDLLASQRVIASAAMATGFGFRYPLLAIALRDLVENEPVAHGGPSSPG